MACACTVQHVMYSLSEIVLLRAFDFKGSISITLIYRIIVTINKNVVKLFQTSKQLITKFVEHNIIA